MTEELDGEQGDLFPKLLQRESLHAEQDRAKKRLQDLRALPGRIESYWQGFYQRKLADWTLEAELKEQYGFDYQFCEDGGLVLKFYYPTPSEMDCPNPTTWRSNKVSLRSLTRNKKRDI